MDARDLTQQQRDQFHAGMAKQLLYVTKVIQRMKARGWYETDPVLLALQGSRDSLRAAMGVIRQTQDRPPPEPEKPFQLPRS